MVIEQIKNQLERLIPIHRVIDLTLTGQAIEHELAMIKVRGIGDKRAEALRIANAFDARVVDATTESFVFEVSGSPTRSSASSLRSAGRTDRSLAHRDRGDHPRPGGYVAGIAAAAAAAKRSIENTNSPSSAADPPGTLDRSCAFLIRIIQQRRFV